MTEKIPTEEETAKLAEVRRIAAEVDKMLDDNPTEIVGAVLAVVAASWLSDFDLPYQDEAYSNFGALVAKQMDLFNQQSGKHIMKGEDFRVVLSEQVRDEIAQHPGGSEQIAELTARIRSALDGVDATDQDAVRRAFESIGGERVTDEEADMIEDRLANYKGPKVN